MDVAMILFSMLMLYPCLADIYGRFLGTGFWLTFQMKRFLPIVGIESQEHSQYEPWQRRRLMQDIFSIFTYIKTRKKL